MMGRGALLAGLLAVAACEPEIGTGAYFCGPERFCPPEMVCREDTVTCVFPSEVVAFSCPAGSEDREPDDRPVDASTFDDVTCDSAQPALTGCTDDRADVDHYAVAVPTCTGAEPRLEAVLRFPLALMPLQVHAIDGDGTVLATGEPCTPGLDLSGLDWVCLRVDDAAGAGVVLVVSGLAGGPDCDGACAYNQYTLAVRGASS